LIEPVTIAHIDPNKVAWARDLQERLPVDPDAPTGVAKVIRTGVPDFFPTITPAMIEAAITDPERKALAIALQLSAAIVVPLTTRGRTIGAISLFRAESGGQYDEIDLDLAQELARRAALSVDNAQLYEATREAEARFRAIYEGAAEAILLIDQRGRIVDVNEAAVRLVGYSRDELRLMPDGAETLLVDQSQVSDLPALQVQGSWHREIVVQRKDGTTVPVETHVAAVDLSEGRVFLALWHDISDRKAAERFEDEFLAQLAHDLMNPLTSARLQSQLLRRWATTGRLENGRVEGAAANVEAETYRIAQRLEDLAALARKRLFPTGESTEASPKVFSTTA
jgi:PAS domain S-box-containing protein